MNTERNTDRITSLAELKDRQLPLQLSGADGNAFAIIGACTRAAKRQGRATPEVVAQIREAMTSQRSYEHLLAWAMEHFDVS